MFDSDYLSQTQVWDDEGLLSFNLDQYKYNWVTVEFTGHFIDTDGWLLVFTNKDGGKHIAYAEIIGDEFLDLDLMVKIEERGQAEHTLENFGQSEIIPELSVQGIQRQYNELTDEIEERIANVVDFADYE